MESRVRAHLLDAQVAHARVIQDLECLAEQGAVLDQRVADVLENLHFLEASEAKKIINLMVF